MAYQYWQHRGEPARTRLRRAARRLPRRHARLGLGRRDRAVPRRCFRPLLFDALARRARRPSRHIARAARAPHSAARSRRWSSSRSCRARPGCSCTPTGYLRGRARAVRRARRAADLRRGRDRLRAHRDDVRGRAGGRRAGPHVRRQGAHRRLPAARGDAHDRARSTRRSSARTRSSRRSSTATPTPATRSPARPRWRRSSCSSPSARSSALQPKIALLGALLAEHVAAAATSARSAGAGSMIGIELGGLRGRGPDRPSGHACRAPARARSSGRSATWWCSCRRWRSPRPSSAARGDHRRRDRGGDRGAARRLSTGVHSFEPAGSHICRVRPGRSEEVPDAPVPWGSRSRRARCARRPGGAGGGAPRRPSRRPGVRPRGPPRRPRTASGEHAGVVRQRAAARRHDARARHRRHQGRRRSSSPTSGGSRRSSARTPGPTTSSAS